jgi:hypothetical protein
MSRGIADFEKRFRGKRVEHDFKVIPRCKHCGRKMKIQARSKPHHVAGREENYDIIKVYRRCGSKVCPGNLEKPIAPPDTIALTGSDIDLDVQAEICEMRFKNNRNAKEIVQHLKEVRGISMCESNIGYILKRYEIGCSQKYKPEVVEKLKGNGGIILTIDAMEPLKGEPSVYMARDELTNTTLGAKQLPNKKVTTIEKFLQDVNKRIDAELGVPVIGIMSDAQKEIVKAAENVFPGVPLYTCEYHFYKLVLKAPMEADSHVMTTIRTILRNMTDIKAYKARDMSKAKSTIESSLCDDIIEVLYALSNWTKKPRDPCFSGLELRSRIVDVLSLVRDVQAEAGALVLTDGEGKILARVKKGLDSCIAKTKHAAPGLERIKEHLKVIVSIFDAETESKEKGLQRLRSFADDLAKASSEKKGTKFEQMFIKALGKFVATKGERLFNHRLVKGAPRTNNHHELEHMHVKHEIRRTIGHAAASYYLLQHGERLFFVNPDESRDGIKKILQNMDNLAARNIIAAERKSRTSISIIMHVVDKWKEKMRTLRDKLANLKRAKTITS